MNADNRTSSDKAIGGFMTYFRQMRWAIGLVACLLLFSGCGFFENLAKGERLNVWIESVVKEGRPLVLALQQFVEEHGSDCPISLEVLVPDYLTRLPQVPLGSHGSWNYGRTIDGSSRTGASSCEIVVYADREVGVWYEDEPILGMVYWPEEEYVGIRDGIKVAPWALWVFEQAGSLSSITTAAGATVATQTYTYNARNQITKELLQDGTPTTTWERDYPYTAFGPLHQDRRPPERVGLHLPARPAGRFTLIQTKDNSGGDTIIWPSDYGGGGSWLPDPGCDQGFEICDS